MDDKERQEMLKQAEHFMQPGHFHRAANIYEDLGMKEKAKEASFSCALDCLNTERYALAIEYLKKSDKIDLSGRLEKICLDMGHSPSMRLEMYACGPSCQSYSLSAESVRRSDSLKKFYTALEKEPFFNSYKDRLDNL